MQNTYNKLEMIISLLHRHTFYQKFQLTCLFSILKLQQHTQSQKSVYKYSIICVIKLSVVTAYFFVVTAYFFEVTAYFIMFCT